MRRQIKQMIVVAVLIGGIPSLAMAQFPGGGNPWQGRTGLPPGIGGFNQYGRQQPNIPGLPPEILRQMQPNLPGLPPGFGTGIPSDPLSSFGLQQPNIPGLSPGFGKSVQGPGTKKPWQWYSVDPPPVTLGGKPMQNFSPKIPGQLPGTGLPPGSGSFAPVPLPQISPDLIRPSTIVMPKLESGLLRSGATTQSEPFRWPSGGVMAAFVAVAVICFLTALGAGYSRARAR
jgi:hypothetical protein